MNILITGTAGFIGSGLARKLLEAGHSVYGIDSINDYYEVTLKLDRLKACGIDRPRPGEPARSSRYEQYTFRQTDLCDAAALNRLFAAERFDCVVNLAAQAGVRYSLTHPESYIQSNIVGFANLLGLSTPEEQERTFNVELPEEIKTALSEIEVEPAMLTHGNRLMDLTLPDNTLVVLVKRESTYRVPTGKTKLTTGDKLLVISDNEEELVKTYNELGVQNYYIEKNS